MNENSCETIWTLLKGGILVALAGVIGADGRPLSNGCMAGANQRSRVPLQVSLSPEESWGGHGEVIGVGAPGGG